jgi:hypothetical protein
MGNALPAAWFGSAGVWVGFVFTLLVFSAIFGDHLLARFAQYVLVGTVLGYAVVVTWQSSLALDFVVTLRSDPQTASWHWLPIGLAVVMAVAGLERIFAQGRAQPPPRGWRQGLRVLGALPALGLVAFSVAVAAVGAVQGTLAPQFLYAARSSLEWGAPPAPFATGVLTLILTVAALVFFVIDPNRHVTHQPRWVQRLVHGWVWVGQRAVWLAAGVLFARLFAARLSLFIAELSHWIWRFQSAEIGSLLERWWRMGMGG